MISEPKLKSTDWQLRTVFSLKSLSKIISADARRSNWYSFFSSQVKIPDKEMAILKFPNLEKVFLRFKLKKRRKELVDHRNQVQQEKEARRAKHARQIAEREAQSERTAFIWDKKGLRALTGGSLRDMFKKFNDAGAPNMEKTKSSIKVDEICNLLCAAVDLKNAGEWVLFGDMVDDPDS